MSSLENTNLRFQFLLLIALTFWTGMGDSSRLKEEFSDRKNGYETVFHGLPLFEYEYSGRRAQRL